VVGASGGIFPGGNGQGNGGLYCSSQGCAPPIDTKFEASFACLNPPCEGSIPDVDWADMSLVDGYTLPYTLQVKTPDGSPCNGNNGPVSSSIDCTQLDLRKCPTTENLSQGLSLTTQTLNPVNLNVKNPVQGALAGCFAPCSKLTSQQWNPLGTYTPGDPQAILYCCPGPITAGQCSAGPVARSDYVQLIHEMCPGVYGYSYDDGNGLFTCTAGSHFTITFFDPVGAAAASTENTASSGLESGYLYIIIPVVIIAVLVAVVVALVVYKWKYRRSEIV